MRAQTHNSNYSEQRKQTIIEIEPYKRKKIHLKETRLAVGIFECKPKKRKRKKKTL